MKLKNALITILFLAVPYVFVCFPVVIYCYDNFNPKPFIFYIIKIYIVVLVVLLICIRIQTIIHETGHLIFGLLTGYRFISWRIGSFMILRLENKIQIKKYSVGGTAGQCLLAPPVMKDEQYPYVLYNLGGVLMNLISAILFYLLSKAIHVQFISVFLVCLAIAAIAMAIGNGIPIKFNLPNDAHNCLSIALYDCCKKAFWIQLQTNALLTEGYDLTELDESFFQFDIQDLHHSLVGFIALNKVCRYLNLGLKDEAYQLIQQVLEVDGMLDFWRNQLLCEKLTIDLVENGDQVDTSEFESSSFAQFFAQMGSQPSIVRAQYALEKIKKHNSKKAEKLYQNYENAKANYPYPLELTYDDQMMKIISKMGEK